MAISKYAISIITVVYDNESTITHCLNSILAQKFTNFELIIVNNGSSEGLTALCEAYKEKDSRVMVIHMDHGAKGIAWNRGIDEAMGRYVLLMEGIGYLEEDVLSKLYEIIIKNLDVIFLPPIEPVAESFEDQSKSVLPLIEPAAESFENQSKSHVLHELGKTLPTHLWDKLIRRGVLFDNNIQFAEDNMWETVDFCMKLYLNAETFGEADFPCYNPLNNEVTFNEFTDEDFGKLLLTLSRWTGPAELVYPDHTTIIHQWMSVIYLEELLPRYGQLSKEARKNYQSAMSDFMWLLDIQPNQDNKIVKMLCTTFGMHMASNLMTAYSALCQKIKSIKSIKYFQNHPVA